MLTITHWLGLQKVVQYTSFDQTKNVDFAERPEAKTNSQVPKIKSSVINQ